MEFIFSCYLISLYPAVQFLSMWLSGIIGSINSNGDCESPGNIPLCIFVSAKLLPLASFHDFLDKVYEFI